MASPYPASIPSRTLPVAGDPTTLPDHAVQHSDANEDVTAICTELGTDPAGASATVKARFDVIEANSWVGTARLADASITNIKLANDSVGTARIAAAAVTTAKIADAAVTDVKLGAPTAGSFGAIRYGRMGEMVSVWCVGALSAATIPTGFRPAEAITVAGVSAAAAAVRFEISTAGSVLGYNSSGSVTPGSFAVTYQRA